MVSNAGKGRPTAIGPVYGGSRIAYKNAHSAPARSTTANSANTRQTVRLSNRDMTTRTTPSDARMGIYHGAIKR